MATYAICFDFYYCRQPSTMAALLAEVFADNHTRCRLDRDWLKIKENILSLSRVISLHLHFIQATWTHFGFGWMVRRKEPLTFHCSVSVMVMIPMWDGPTNEHMPYCSWCSKCNYNWKLDYLGYRLSIDTIHICKIRYKMYRYWTTKSCTP